MIGPISSAYKSRRATHEQLILPRHQSHERLTAQHARNFSEIRRRSCLCGSCLEIGRLVEKAESHILVGLLLLLLLLLNGLSGGSATGSSTASRGSTTATARGNGSELRRASGDQL